MNGNSYDVMHLALNKACRLAPWEQCPQAENKQILFPSNANKNAYRNLFDGTNSGIPFLQRLYVFQFVFIFL